MRRLMLLTEASENSEQLVTTVNLWLEGRTELASPLLLRHADILRRYATLPAGAMLYRGIALSPDTIARLRHGDALTLQSRSQLSSWSLSLTSVVNFMNGYENYVVVRRPSADLDVFCVIDQLRRRYPAIYRDTGKQREVIVKNAPSLTVQKRNIVKIETWPRV